MKPKLWQVALIVVGLLVGIGSVVYSIVTAETVPITNVTHCVDVETGDLYKIEFPVILPAAHPTTGVRSLVRVKNDGGKWYVSGRDLELIRLLDKGVQNKVVDTETGDLKVEIKAPIAYPKPK